MHNKSPKKVELYYSDAVLQSNAQVTQELEIAKQEIDDARGIDLGQHRVFRVADEGLDLQILLDEAEEDLDLQRSLLLSAMVLAASLKWLGRKTQRLTVAASC